METLFLLVGLFTLARDSALSWPPFRDAWAVSKGSELRRAIFLILRSRSETTNGRIKRGVLIRFTFWSEMERPSFWLIWPFQCSLEAKALQALLL